ncbi:UPF0758 protein YfjY [Shewanella colwelliana]|uniref:UPF0758 protein YfjY n=1 Tax=Shewanella colwelliana TaxID=23 RepID=A0ABQ4P075_SHECO|nr:JAB domain-containing protein [Shewanella colwelliana]GIU40871.1 UPF0758 protein YfjY [Shewanella colwelliana]
MFEIKEKNGVYQVTGQGDFKALVNKLSQVSARLLAERAQFTCPKDVIEYARPMMMDAENEQFWCMYLSSQNEVIEFMPMFLGSVSSSRIHPRVIVKTALEFNARAVILAHNHPSGHPEPSDNDFAATKQIQQALRLVEVDVLDHIIYGVGKPYSMAEHGQL